MLYLRESVRNKHMLVMWLLHIPRLANYCLVSSVRCLVSCVSRVIDRGKPRRTIDETVKFRRI